MKALFRLRPGLAVLTALALSSPSASWAAAGASGGADLGKVGFPTSASPAAQAHFVRGVAALHSFWYDEAADAFREAQKAEPGFALAYWGEAMTYNHPIWSEQDLDAARGALARLAPTREERAAKAPTPREKAYLEAAEILFGEGGKEARDRAYAEAMGQLHARFPDDFDGAAFYSLSLIGPALTHEAEREQRVRTLVRAAAILEELFDQNPQHPGVVHYLIHAYDDPEHAPLGLRAARIYAQVAPAAHHALHMPSHIFLQIGDWDRTVASNESSWAASVAWVERRKLSPDKRDFHSLSWLAYAYLQQGRIAKAKELLKIADQAAATGTKNPRVVSAELMMNAAYQIETRDWRKAAPAAAKGKEDPNGKGAHCGGASYLSDDGTVLLAAGLGAIHAGDLAAAEEAAGGLREAAADGKGGREAQVMEKEVAGRILLAKGQTEEALKALAEAADLESRLAPPSGPPMPVKPAHELYGEALLELGKYKEAAAQFEKSLLRTPNRTASLLGAARAAAKLGDGETARQRYATLAKIWRQADAGLPDVAEAKSYLAQASAR